jgi:hypothetical protein
MGTVNDYERNPVKIIGVSKRGNLEENQDE